MRIRWDSLRALLTAPHCLLCHGRSEDLLCSGCRDELPWNRLACPQCARPLAGGPVRICPPCMKRAPPFNAALAAFLYTAPVDGAIQRLKYQADFLAGRWLADALHDAVITRHNEAASALPDLLLPVPLHPLRLARRGYNQSQLIARRLSQRLRLPLARARRVRRTEDQIGKSAAERRRNVRKAFTVSAAVRGKAVALIDDVMTTGSTVAELARCCRRAGATRVEVWTLARVP